MVVDHQIIVDIVVAIKIPMVVDHQIIVDIVVATKIPMVVEHQIIVEYRGIDKNPDGRRPSNYCRISWHRQESGWS
jgi:hypothetical protein